MLWDFGKVTKFPCFPGTGGKTTKFHVGHDQKFPPFFSQENTSAMVCITWDGGEKCEKNKTGLCPDFCPLEPGKPWRYVFYS